MPHRVLPSFTTLGPSERAAAELSSIAMRAAFALIVLLLSTPASAQSYGVAPVVSAQRAGDGGRASASMDVRAPPSAVWAILSDCAQARRFMRDLVSCRVLESGEGWDIREHRARGCAVCPVMRNVSRITLEPNRRLAFNRVEGDWTRSEGEWRLTPIDGGRGTHVEYQIDAAFRGPLPAGVSQSFLVSGVRSTLANLRRVVERAAGSAQSAP
jgi:uncharacterized protein YndB with AHSA1/START domain